MFEIYIRKTTATRTFEINNVQIRKWKHCSITKFDKKDLLFYFFDRYNVEFVKSGT